MSRTYNIYLLDIIKAITRIETYLQDTTLIEFENDEMRFDAVIRNLEVIGEAVKRVPESIRQRH